MDVVEPTGIRVSADQELASPGGATTGAGIAGAAITTDGRGGMLPAPSLVVPLVEGDLWSVLDAIGQPLVVHDAEWRFRYVNPSAEAVFASGGGRSREAVLGRVVWELYPELVGTRFEREMRRAGAERVPTVFEEYYPRRGSWSSVHCFPLPSGGTVTLWRDITAEKRAQEALHLLSEASRLLGSSLEYEVTLRSVARLLVPRLADWCSVDVLEEDGRLKRLAVAHVDAEKVRWATELTRRLLADPGAPMGLYQVVRSGRPELFPEIPDDVLAAAATQPEYLRVLRELGLQSAMVVPLAARGRVLGVLTLVSAESARRYGGPDLAVALELATRAALAMENARLHRESEAARLRLEDQATELEAQTHELQAQAVHLEEIQAELERANRDLVVTNERLAAEAREAEAARARAERADQARAGFLATMSHELRTPLNAMIGYTDLMLLGVPERLPAEMRSHAERIARASRHLLSIIEEILTFSRLDAGKEEVIPGVVDLRELVDEVSAVIEPLAAARSIAFRAPERLPVPELTTDPRKLRQILINLLGNAVKFTHRGEVELSVLRSGRDLAFRIRDTGLGIATEHLQEIFEPFRQIDDGRTRTAGGTGLGLAVSRRLARLLGGDVVVRSTVTEGSVFELWLPIVPEGLL